MNRITMIEIKRDGEVVEQIPEVDSAGYLDGTLLHALYPTIKVALVTVPTEPLEEYEEARLASQLAVLEHDGVNYHMIGASSSAKNGKFYFVDEGHSRQIADRFAKWPEAAITYFGILVSNCKVVIQECNIGVLVVPDRGLGTNDCRGWVSERLFQKLELPPGRFYQFRLAFTAVDETQAKGAFKVMDDAVADTLGADIIIPESSIKPCPTFELSSRGRIFRGPIALGVRDLSRPLSFESSYTLLEHAPLESIEQEIIPQAQEEIQSLRAAWADANHQAVVEKIGSKISADHDYAGNDVEYQRTCEALLLADGSGEITRHPYVYMQLNKLMARWAYKLLTGGGLSLPAFALADDGYLFLRGGTVCHGADWLPTHKAITSVPSEYGLCARYPIRMFEDLLPMQHLHSPQVADELATREGIDAEEAGRIADRQLCLEGAYVLNSGTAKLNGGDFDFDLVCVLDGSQYPKFVAHRFNLVSPQAITKEKANKARSAWWNLEFVALKARGNRIGAITDLKTRCYAAGRHDLAYRLVPELQREIDSLKWGVRADPKVLKEIRDQVPMTPWLTLKDVEAVCELPLQLEVLPSDVIGRLYNTLRKDIAELMETPLAIAEFKGLITGNTTSKEMFEEARLVNAMYAAAHGQISGQIKASTDNLTKAEKAMAEAGDNKEAKRQATRKLYEARASLNKTLENARKQSCAIAKLIALWGRGKEKNRRGWAEALHQVVCHGRGKGSILFHAFPQEAVDMIAERTNGIRTLVQDIDARGIVVVENGRFYHQVGTERRFVLRYDREDGGISLRERPRRKKPRVAKESMAVTVS
jgi:hypothetical protein